ncbi:hypothetical protein TEA_019293 [Camellia sinensis var. sinensis]|uniref:Uncharacterized protein n=1 Tax=Camellia sinensis var. sinensis TaxID=542762 RepID=A0A4S4EFM7_CAMSN|nr:hypothetical protein TEA_019293 [Camellia sinensis var. sinensis]
MPEMTRLHQLVPGNFVTPPTRSGSFIYLLHPRLKLRLTVDLLRVVVLFSVLCCCLLHIPWESSGDDHFDLESQSHLLVKDGGDNSTASTSGPSHRWRSIIIILHVRQAFISSARNKSLAVDGIAVVPPPPSIATSNTGGDGDGLDLVDKLVLVVLLVHKVVNLGLVVLAVQVAVGGVGNPFELDLRKDLQKSVLLLKMSNILNVALKQAEYVIHDKEQSCRGG